MKYFLSAFFVLFCWCELLFAQAFIPNEGQWKNEVLFQTDIKSGRAFLCSDRIRFCLYDAAIVAEVHEQRESISPENDTISFNSKPIQCFSYEVNFLNAGSSSVTGRGKQKATSSYFLGNDPSRWKGGVPMYDQVEYKSLYDGIDLVFHNKASTLKYDFVLAPGSNPNDISMEYTGQQSLVIRDGRLVIDAGFTSVREMIPEAYQVINGIKNIIPCTFLLQGTRVSFFFPYGYNPDYTLVIDPEVIASTYNGGTAMSFGFTATYDDSENIYAGGIVFDQGYPVTLGAFDVAFDSVFDMGISKFDPTGANLLSCTYVGGNLEEYPLSMYAQGDKLYVYGRTRSMDFPTTSSAFDQTYGGMNDIVVFCLNSDLSVLQASTFVGSTGDDGVNFNSFNLFDAYRGEIVVHSDGTVYVVSGSNSALFPVTSGAYCTTHNGGVDVVLFRMDATLSTMLWATFLGSGMNDGGMGLRVDESGYVFVTGSARNIFGGWPTVTGCYQTTYGGGAMDAFIAKFDPTGANLVAHTFFGGAGVDIGYFLDLDSDGNVYINCTYPGAPVTSGVYSNPGSENCIACFDAGLTTLQFSTVIGDGTTTGKIVPSAFMVDQCKRMYIGGFGGSQGWPITSDALYSTWNGHTQWYLASLSENAADLLFATFYGSWHVDGGTSRFDPKGVIYQAVCADSAEFPTTSWAYSDGSLTNGWSICAFKIDFQVERDAVNLPNIFTPNGDGINDVYDVGLSSANFFEVKIINRWGVEVFSTNTLGATWDGKYNGRECDVGVYYVICRHGYCTGEPYITTGFFHLQR